MVYFPTIIFVCLAQAGFVGRSEVCVCLWNLGLIQDLMGGVCNWPGLYFFGGFFWWASNKCFLPLVMCKAEWCTCYHVNHVHLISQQLFFSWWLSWWFFFSRELNHLLINSLFLFLCFFSTIFSYFVKSSLSFICPSKLHKPSANQISMIYNVSLFLCNKPWC